MNEEEQTPVRQLRQQVRWSDWVQAAEKIKGKRWAEWAERHGDWSRDALMYVAVRRGGLRLAEVVRELGVKYQAAQAVKRFGEALPKDEERQRFVAALNRQLSTIDSAEKPPPLFFPLGGPGWIGDAP